MTTIKARPTTYKGIRMRSRLEADYAAHLDRNGEEWDYEPECFAGDEGQWLPDFRVGGADVLTEVKSAHLLDRQEGEDGIDTIGRIDLILERMAIAWHSKPDASLELVFWTYGASAPILTLNGHKDLPWLAYAGGLPVFPLAWAGMGQFIALMAERRRAA